MIRTKRPHLPLSVFIITKDEEDRLPKAINSVIGWVKEVIVIDSGSQDKTVEIAKNFGAKVMHNDWRGYGEQKIFGEKQCSQEWILNIDADEEVTNDLKNEIIDLFNQDKINKYSGYVITVKVVKFFTESLPLWGPRTTCIRLYNKTKAGFSNSTVHDSVIAKEGSTSKCKGFIKHRTFRSYSHALRKVDSYSTAQAQDIFNKGKNPSNLRIIFEPIFAFFKGYIFKRSFTLGIDGIIISYIYIIGRLMRLIKARELFILRNKDKNS